MAFGFTATAGTITGTHSGYVGLFTTANFPAGSLSGANAIINGGGNLRAYTDSTKATALPLEIVTLVTGGSAEAQVWVRLNSLSTSGTAYLEADDTETTQPAVTAPLGRNAVWSGGEYSNHMDDTGLLNSANGSTGVFESGTPTQVVGKIGNGRDFTSEGLATGESILAGSSSFVISAWCRWDGGTSGAEGSIADSWDLGNTSFFVRYEPGGGGAIEFNVNDGSTNSGSFNNTSLSDGQFHLIHARLSGGSMEVFRDGIKSSTVVSSGAIASVSPAALKIGRSVFNNSGNDFFVGVLDGVYVGSSKSDDHIATEYDNQNSPSTFWTSSAWAEQATGITVTGATASYVYNGVIGTIELTGEIVVTGSTASYAYNGVNGDIDLASEILITGQTAYYSYVGLSGSVDLSGLISVTGQTASYDYDGVSGELILQGTIIVTGDTANYAYNALNGTIIIQGPITVNPKNVITVKRKSNDIIVSRKSNTVRVK